MQKRYRIIRPIGRGGMGQVYEAIDDTVDSIVVIKETLASTDKLRNAFAHEAKLLANLKHPALPRVTHYFLEGDDQFLVMEFIEGRNLAELLKLRGRPFGYEKIVTWTDKLLDALSYLHGQREPVIHRDIKPANIKVTDEEDIYLLDFGLAKGAPGLETSSVQGYTAAYAPLEQLTNSGTSSQSDLYSLGATLYHLLTGRPPESASERYEAMEEGIGDPLRPANQLNPEVPETISMVVSHALAMKRMERFASADAMREALREAASVAEREREEQILNTPTLPMENLQAILSLTEPVADPARQQGGSQAAHEAQSARSEDSYIKTIPAKPPVVPPPPIDSTQPSWPSQIYSDSSSLKEEGSEQSKQLRSAPHFWNKRRIAGAVIILVVTTSAFVVVLLRQRSAKTSETPHAVRAADVAVKNNIGMEFVYVPAGSYMMGSKTGEDDEKPVHLVTIREGFYMGKYEVTQAEWQRVMGTNPSRFKGESLPVEQVSWNDAQLFLQKLNATNDGFIYRLPTEAEWEYACRAGTTTDYAGDLDSMAWYGHNSGRQYLKEFERANAAETYELLEKNGSQTHPVGTKTPNAFGLYDMLGNVFEWCQDYQDSYAATPTDGSAWNGAGLKERVYRGGAWSSYASFLRSADRHSDAPDLGNFNRGLRVVAIRSESDANTIRTR
ncbi:MAG TPA: SUMF1/EgtB/PvdO family nonheme iron enzyme [Pyrinomonadaceae bacterium]|nr:SUMF1/EgtB/PvdO family nonheme iron enzyme [Pyrinomonadaceae bacterium]